MAPIGHGGRRVQRSAGGRLGRPYTPSWKMRTVFCRQDCVRWATDNAVGREGRALGSVVRRVTVAVCPLMLASGRVSVTHDLILSSKQSCWDLPTTHVSGTQLWPRGVWDHTQGHQAREVELACRPRRVLVPPSPSPAPL